MFLSTLNQHFLFVLVYLYGYRAVEIYNLNSISQPVLQKTIYVNEYVNKFYQYEIYSQDGDILVNIFDQDLNSYNLTFSKANNLYFRDAYYNYIVLQQRTTNATVSFWTLEIVQDSQNNTYELASFSTSSQVDNQDYDISQDYLLKSIIQYNRDDKILYVNLDNQNDTDFYGIDVGNKGPILITIGWFFYNKQSKENIIGGNSRVLVQATNDQIWIDTRNIRNNDSDPTVYDQYNISSLTSLPIYPGGSHVFNLINSYFQYVSISQDGKSITTFAYHGYQKITPEGQYSMTSQTKQLKLFHDSYNYFFVFGDNDSYLSSVYLDQNSKNYIYTSRTLKNLNLDSDTQALFIQIFNSALWIIYNDDKYYVLNADSFYVFGIVPTDYSQVYYLALSQVVKQGDNTRIIQFSQIKEYTLSH